MKKVSNNLEKHLLICCNVKPDGSGCGTKGADLLRSNLKERVQAMKNPLRKVSKCGCLGDCKEGISAVLYPDGQKITEIVAGDEDELLKMVMGEI